MNDILNSLPSHYLTNVANLSSNELKDISLSDIGLTSMEIVELLVKLEENFSIEFPEIYLLEFGFLKLEDIVHFLEVESKIL